MSSQFKDVAPLPAPEVMKTARLTLRCPRVEDAQAMYEEYAGDPRVTRYLNFPTSKSAEETQTWLGGALQRWRSGEEFVWAITLGLENRPLGSVGCRPRGCGVEIGYSLAARLWNQGLVTEAARAVADWAIACGPIFRVWAVCDCANAASARVMEKTGMQREGVLRRWTVFPNLSAEPRDCFVYSRTR